MKFIRLSDASLGQESASNEQFAIDVLIGLCSNPKKISSKYFYDDRGSELFQKITRHPDYYPAKIEFEILKRISESIPDYIQNKAIDVVELGAGDGHKSRLIIEGFLKAGKQVTYYPIDISERAMELLDQQFNEQDNLHVQPVIAEYFEGLKHVRQLSENPMFVLFLGSNIGNFDRYQNQGFLRKLWKQLNHNDFALIGFDLKKDVSILNRAYNDSAGYTQDFNLNLLTRMNRELGANFDITQFQHFGSYNPVLGAMESYLLAKSHQRVFIKELERSFEFLAYEPIHLEYSFKYLESDVDYLASQTGFHVAEHFTDGSNYFIDSLWQVVKGH